MVTHCLVSYQYFGENYVEEKLVVLFYKIYYIVRKDIWFGMFHQMFEKICEMNKL